MAQQPDHWPLEPEPTTLIALWPGEEAPTAIEVRAALESGAGAAAQVVDELESDDPDILWSIVIELPGLPSPAIVWVEPARPLGLETLDDPTVTACRWVVGLETLLDESDPLTEFTALMRVLVAAFDDLPAVLDVNSTRVCVRQELIDLYGSEQIEPPADVLWIIHAVSRDNPAADDPPVWLHTHGLWRCGIPELEMLEVPRSQAMVIAGLINDIASLVMETGMPAPATPFEIGNDLFVSMHPWQEVVATLDAESPGSESDRRDAHTGTRAVICAQKPSGMFKEVWTWPRDVYERLEDESAVVYRSLRATQRQSRLARAAWAQLAMAFAACRSPSAEAAADQGVVFLVKAGFRQDDAGDEDDGAREHLWFEVRRFDGDRAEGELINQPLNVAGLTKGQVIWVHRDTISDWQVLMAAGRFGPSGVEPLWRAIGELRDGAAT